MDTFWGEADLRMGWFVTEGVGIKRHWLLVH